MVQTLDIDAEFELGETSVRAGMSSPASAGVVHRRQTWSGELRRWTLAWHNANDARVARLRDIWERSLYGSLWITWSPPGEAADTFRILNPGLVIRRYSATAYSASLELEEVA